MTKYFHLAKVETKRKTRIIDERDPAKNERIPAKNVRHNLSFFQPG
jgi:hypothetical protein